MKRNIPIFFIPCCLLMVFCGCNKLVQIPAPASSLTADKTFASDASATSAVTGIYSYLSTGYASGFRLSFCNGMTTICAGVCSDELIDYGNAYPQFSADNLLSNNATVNGGFWSTAYYAIDMANGAVQGLQSSTGLTPATKSQLLGEAKFLRAFCYFYLVNLFGDIPLVTNTDWTDNKTASRSSAALVYTQIITDLTDAQGLLVKDYSYSGTERTRANYWAATALLARVYLYTGDWKDAEEQSTAVISSGNFSLLTDLTTVFLKNSNESILQLQTINAGIYATEEGGNLIPRKLTIGVPQATINASPSTYIPPYQLTSQLIAAFEPGDLRLLKFMDTTAPIKGVKYYFPYKYKVRTGTSGNVAEYYTLLRFAEQYLIRAEAVAQENTNLGNAVADLNTIRARAGLAALPATLGQSAVLAAVAQERRVELAAEWGHRWLDLKRTGQANAVLGPMKQAWSANAALWPIPQSELLVDPNLTQNTGY